MLPTTHVRMASEPPYSFTLPYWAIPRPKRQLEEFIIYNGPNQLASRERPLLACSYIEDRAFATGVNPPSIVEDTGS